MADYYLILKRAIEREPEVDAYGREALYEKARAALDRQLDALDPAPSEEQIARVRGTLDDAVARLEAEYAPLDDDVPTIETGPASGAVSEPLIVDPAAVPPPADAPPPLVTPAGAPLADATDIPPVSGLDEAAALVDGAARTLSQQKDEVSAPPYEASPEPVREGEGPTEPTPSAFSVETNAADAPLEGTDSAIAASEIVVETDDDDADDLDESDTHSDAWEPSAIVPTGSVAADQTSRWAGLRSGDRRAGSKSRKDAASGSSRDVSKGRTAGAKRGAVPAALAKRQRGRSAWPVAAALLVLVGIVAAVGIWQRDALMAAVQSPPPVSTVDIGDDDAAAGIKIGERVTADGVTQETDTPVDTTSTATSGEAVRDVGGDAILPSPQGPPNEIETTALTTPTAADEPAASTPSAPAPDATPAPAGSAEAVLFEERLLVQGQGDRYPGSVTWTAEKEPGSDETEQTILRGLVRVPDRNLDVLLTIRRNDDETLPASHTIELLFETGDTFEPGGVANVMGILMKPAEEAQLGTPLKGASARITDGYFLIGLSSLAQDEAKNVSLLQDEPRLEIPILYNNGQRAILELQKGSDGATAFAEAFGAWSG